MLPNDHKPWAKTVARTVICATIVLLAALTYFLKTHNSLHISEIVGIVLLLLTIVPPNLAVLYPGLIPAKRLPNHGSSTNSTIR
jgi:hypothetical protein